MERLSGKCPGDCSKCELLATGSVDMVPCILDQIFARTQRIEAHLSKDQDTTLRLAGN